MRYVWYFAGLAIGIFGLYSWYVETYTDSPIAALWREMGDRNDKTTSGDSLSPLFMSAGFSLFALGAILSDLVSNIRIVLISFLSIAYVGLALMVVGFICFFPFPVPRWADARYQYMKRHGMLDKNGDPIDFDGSSELSVGDRVLVGGCG